MRKFLQILFWLNIQVNTPFRFQFLSLINNINMFPILGLVEVPAIGLSIIFLLYRGRRWPLCLTLAGSGVACLVTLIVPSKFIFIF